MDLLVDLLLPRTDVGSLTQAIVIGVSLALWRLWSRSDLTLLIIGLVVPLRAHRAEPFTDELNADSVRLIPLTHQTLMGEDGGVEERKSLIKLRFQTPNIADTEFCTCVPSAMGAPQTSGSRQPFVTNM